MKERAIQSQECINEGASFIANIEPRFKYALEVTGELPLRLSPEGFERLFRCDNKSTSKCGCC